MRIHLNRTQLIILALAVALIISVPITVLQLKKQQENRSRAAGTATLLLSPETSTQALGDTFPVQVALQADNMNVTGVDITLSYTPTTFDFVAFEPSTALATTLINGPVNIRAGTYRYAAVSTTASTASGFITLGTLRLKGKALARGTIQFANNQITAAGSSTAVSTINNTQALYTISASTASPTPTACIGRGCVTPTPTTTATCPRGGLLCGTIFSDNNDNGVIDSGENGIPNVAVTIKSVSRVGNVTVANLTTNTSGFYSYTPTVQARYIVEVALPSGFHAGTNQTLSKPVDPPFSGQTNFALIPNVSPSPTGTISVTLSPTAPLSPTATLTPSPTFPPGTTTLSLTIAFPGIGNGSGDNKNPKHAVKNVEVSLVNSQNQVAATVQGTLTFDGTYFTGTVALPSSLQTGSYFALVKMDNTLKKRTSGILSITAGASNAAPLLGVVPGDINQDNVLDIKDYNAFMACFGDKVCPNKDLADISEDGVVDEVDLNLLQRAFAIRHGDDTINSNGGGISGPTITTQPTP